MSVISHRNKQYSEILFLMLVLGVFVFYPIARAVMEPNLEDWILVLTRERWRRIMMNTVVITVLSTATASIIGFAFAYAIESVRVPGHKIFRIIALMPLLSPPFIGSIAVIMLLGRQGFITHHLLNLDFQIFGWHGIWIVQTFTFFPLAYLSIASVLRGLNPNLEHAARDLGASRWTIFRTVVLPLAKPGIISAILLVAIFVLSDFANPLVMGGRFGVLATEAYSQVVGWGNLGTGAALASVLSVPALLLFFLQRHILSRGSYVTVSGKGGGNLGPVPSNVAVKTLLIAVCGFVSAYILAINAAIVVASLTSAGFRFQSNFDNIRYALTQHRVIANSVRFAAVAGFVCALLGTFAAYVVHRGSFRGKTFLDFSFLLPAAIPGTLTGISFILAFNQPPLILTGTSLIIVAAMVLRQLPVGFRSATSSLMQIDRSLEESAMDLGAGRSRIFRTIILPLVAPAFASTMVYTFLVSIYTLSAVIFLTTTRTNLATVTILSLAERGQWGLAAALSLVITVLVLTSLAIVKVTLGKRVKVFDF